MLVEAVFSPSAAIAQNDVSVRKWPPRADGWANWNSLGCNYNKEPSRDCRPDGLIRMKDAGYRYLIIQECIVPAASRCGGTLLPI